MNKRFDERTVTNVLVKHMAVSIDSASKVVNVNYDLGVGIRTLAKIDYLRSAHGYTVIKGGVKKNKVFNKPSEQDVKINDKRSVKLGTLKVNKK